MAAEAAGVSLGCIYRLRRVEAGFIEKMQAAVEAADRWLEADEEEGQSQAAVPGDCPQDALVIRRGRGGRLRVMAAGPRAWTERHDPVFFAHLRSTGSVAASARAAGFTPKSAWNRRDRLPQFARAMDEARDDADMALEYELAEAKNGERKAGVDRDRAIRTLRFRENRRRGIHSPRRPAPPPIEAVAERIERKVRAIVRHRKPKP